ncbi:MAG: glycosyltransferase [Desulfobulbaceae bacterium]|nr:glycosyltransferase [Desulfobulbaceae bacterium]
MAIDTTMNVPQPLPHSGATIMVTVTYGDRLQFLAESVRRALADEGVTRVVIVSNASTSPLETLEQRWADRVRIIRLPENTGSANGYSVGIRAALEDGAEYLWLMDDDNAPQPGALAKLVATREELRESLALADFALLSFRPALHSDIGRGMPTDLLFARPGSFFGFHLLDLPAKLWQRTPWGRPAPPKKLPELIPLPRAPYGGFYCHRSVYERIGLPNPELILYGDDTDLTLRLGDDGGKIFLVTASLVDDLEPSCNDKSRFGSAANVLLSDNSAFRAFYSARNHAYLESRTCDHKIARAANRLAYLIILLVMASRQGRLIRYRLFLEAVNRGEAGIIGLDDRFPLP